MNRKNDLIVIGGGVLGSFHAYHAMNMGLKVSLVEKDYLLQGATVRNFGQVVPSGMNTKWQRYGRESLAIYKEIQSKFDISVRQEGSVYIASNKQEVELLHELEAINKANAYRSILMSKKQLLDAYPGINKAYAQEALFFPDEILIEPRTMIHKLHGYLKEKGLHLVLGNKAIQCTKTSEGVEVVLSDGKKLSAAKVLICNGSDFETLFPNLFLASDLELVKLQMMSTVPQPKNYKLSGAVLTGLTIRRYEAFSECVSYKHIKELEPEDSEEKKRGVHILFKQAVDGSVIIGDSHQYASVKEKNTLGFDLDMRIDRFLTEEAKKICELPDYTIARRWYGIYTQSKSEDIFERTIDEDIHIITGIGGKGMTGSAGFAKENITKIFNT